MNDGEVSCAFFSKTPDFLFAVVFTRKKMALDAACVFQRFFGWKLGVCFTESPHPHPTAATLNKTTVSCALSGNSWERHPLVVNQDIPHKRIFQPNQSTIFLFPSFHVNASGPDGQQVRKMRLCSLCICRTSSSRSFLTPVPLSLLHHLGLPRVGFTLATERARGADKERNVMSPTVWQGDGEELGPTSLSGVHPPTHRLLLSWLDFLAFFTFAACTDLGEAQTPSKRRDIWRRA